MVSIIEDLFEARSRADPRISTSRSRSFRLRDTHLLFNCFDMRPLSLCVASATIDLGDSWGPPVDDDRVEFADLGVLCRSADERTARTLDTQNDDPFLHEASVCEGSAGQPFAGLKPKI